MIKAWQEKKTPEELGALIGQLRVDFFQAALQEGGFINPANINSFQDAGQFFELILHVIGHDFPQKEIKTPYDAAGKEIVRKVNPQNLINPILSKAIFITRGQGTVQERINVAGFPEIQNADGWIITTPNNEQVIAAEMIETYKIVGNPPEFLVISVNRFENTAIGVQDVGHVVTPADFLVDFSPIFEEQIPQGQAQYELVGFSQNYIPQIHWTSVVRQGQEWHHCNDDIVTPITPNIAHFKSPANYMVYKRK
jgi:hypothetical protein